MHRERRTLDMPIGAVGLWAEDTALVKIELRPPGPLTRWPRGGILCQAARQLREYFAGDRQVFDIPLRRPISCTPFQTRVWDALLAIPLGETRTYGELAELLGTSARAVGGACARNPFPIVVPCHRVVARSGLGGFSGDWETGLALDIKQTLLEHEARLRKLSK